MIAPKPPCLQLETRGDADLEQGERMLDQAARLAGSGLRDEAVELLRALSRSKLAELAPEVALRLAEIYEKDRYWPQAAREYERAAELANPRQHAGVILDLAQRWESLGDRDAALEACISVAENCPDPASVAMAAYRAGVLESERGSVRAPLYWWERAAALAEPQLRPWILIELADALIGSDDAADRQRGQLSYREVIESDHPDLGPRAALALALWYESQGDFARSAEALRWVIESEAPAHAADAEMARERVLERALQRWLDGPADRERTTEIWDRSSERSAGFVSFAGTRIDVDGPRLDESEAIDERLEVEHSSAGWTQLCTDPLIGAPVWSDPSAHERLFRRDPIWAVRVFGFRTQSPFLSDADRDRTRSAFRPSDRLPIGDPWPISDLLGAWSVIWALSERSSFVRDRGDLRAGLPRRSGGELALSRLISRCGPGSPAAASRDDSPARTVTLAQVGAHPAGSSALGSALCSHGLGSIASGGRMSSLVRALAGDRAGLLRSSFAQAASGAIPIALEEGSLGHQRHGAVHTDEETIISPSWTAFVAQVGRAMADAPAVDLTAPSLALFAPVCDSAEAEQCHRSGESEAYARPEGALGAPSLPH